MFVPIISPLVLEGMVKSCAPGAGWCDNVLLEWMLALILVQQQKVGVGDECALGEAYNALIEGLLRAVHGVSMSAAIRLA
jgi:hypothetical protein